MREALDRWPDLTAVFGVNDSVAIGAPRSAAELARQAPRDLAVFGFDDIQLGSPQPASPAHGPCL
jgi:DNA-binding LacI/PurR family transcriptional regulator